MAQLSDCPDIRSGKLPLVFSDSDKAEQYSGFAIRWQGWSYFRYRAVPVSLGGIKTTPGAPKPLVTGVSPWNKDNGRARSPYPGGNFALPKLSRIPAGWRAAELRIST